VSIEQSRSSLINPFACWDAVYFWFHQNFPTMWSIFVYDGTPLAVVIRPLNSILCFKSAVWWNLLALIVQQLLLIFLGFCREGLLAFIPVSLQLSTTVQCDWRVQCYDFIFTTTRSKKVAKQLLGSFRERDKSLEQANDAATVLHYHVVMAPN